MEQELRDAFREVKENTNVGVAKVEGEIKGLQHGLQAHMLESATRHVEVAGISKAAHKRLDEHLEDHKTTAGRRWELILALVISALSGVGTLVMTLYQLLKKP